MIGKSFFLLPSSFSQGETLAPTWFVPHKIVDVMNRVSTKEKNPINYILASQLVKYLMDKSWVQSIRLSAKIAKNFHIIYSR
ncbi:hypothetical protein A2T98_08025 [Nodularia spumigena CENA596]|jgi:hypothetical protein|uniref:Uncharacterized protein n=1 Tax=Nodularia spumigena CENA596 TaxID=1819295 RepID=A0A161XKU7_NODSP|nr:hypothetical protein N9414_01652 [Nodularia spumigena CCY9414]KZL50341.1 hypothetical protein A2T98_08025 [Nodularia spumigena CENA596]